MVLVAGTAGELSPLLCECLQYDNMHFQSIIEDLNICRVNDETSRLKYVVVLTWCMFLAGKAYEVSIVLAIQTEYFPF